MHNVKASVPLKQEAKAAAGQVEPVKAEAVKPEAVKAPTPVAAAPAVAVNPDAVKVK
jgi:hypothetical protein